MSLVPYGTQPPAWTQRFHYPPLHKDAPSIRLLRLLASGSPPNLKCELTLSYVGGGDSYEAVSYFWGRGGSQGKLRNRVISLDNRYFQVTPVVEDILLRLHDPAKDRLLWIDLVCIDQDNIEEKNRQVSRMKDIFKHAWRVIACLGPLQTPAYSQWAPFGPQYYGNSPAATEHIQNPLHIIAHWAATRAGDNAVFPSSASETYSVIEFMKDPWFSRIVILSGRELKKQIKKREPLLTAIIATEAFKPSRLLVEVMHEFRTWDATDARDKVYALLGLCVDDLSAPELQVDYNITVSETYKRVAIHSVRMSASLSVLTYCSPMQINGDFLSWVPEWNSPSLEARPAPIPTKLKAKLEPSSTSSMLNQAGLITIKTSALPVKGYQIGSITSVFRDGSVESVPHSNMSYLSFDWPYTTISRHLTQLSISLINAGGNGLHIGDLICILHGSTGIALLRRIYDLLFKLVVLQHSQFPLYGAFLFNDEQHKNVKRYTVQGGAITRTPFHDLSFDRLPYFVRPETFFLS